MHVYCVLKLRACNLSKANKHKKFVANSIEINVLGCLENFLALSSPFRSMPCHWRCVGRTCVHVCKIIIFYMCSESTMHSLLSRLSLCLYTDDEKIFNECKKESKNSFDVEHANIPKSNSLKTLRWSHRISLNGFLRLD